MTNPGGVRWGRAGRARIEQELAWGHQAPRYVGVYETLTDGSRGRPAVTAGG